MQLSESDDVIQEKQLILLDTGSSATVFCNPDRIMLQISEHPTRF